MADAIVIKIGLDASDIGNAQGKIRASVKSALDSALPDAKEVGKKIGNALADGMAEGIAKARQLRTQLDQILSPVARQRTNESAEVKHQQKLNEIRERGAQQQASIAAKAAAQEATIRAKAAADAERDARRFAEAQARIAGRGAPPDSLITFFKRYSSVIREAGESIQFAGGFFSSIGGQILNIGKSSIEASGKVESVSRAFKLLDKDKSGETLARLRKQADELSTSFIGYAEQVNRVRQTQKLTAEQSETLVKGLINVGRAAGVSREAQDRAVTALNQILAKGKVTAEELRGQLLEAIPNLAPIIEKRFGSLNAEVLEKKFGAKKFVAGLIEEFGKLQNLEPTGLEKFQVSLENLQIKLAPVGNKVLEFLNQNIEPLTRALESLINTFNSFTPATQEMIIKFGVLAIAIGPVIQGFGALVQLVGGMGNLVAVVAKLGATSTATASATTGLGAAIAGLNPIVLGLGIALVAGTALWIGYGKTMDGIKDRFATIEQQAARARGEITLLDGTIQKTSDQKFQLNPALNDSRVKNLKIKSQTVDFGNAVKVGPDGKPLNPSDIFSAPSILGGGGSGGTGRTGAAVKSVEESLLERLTKQAKEADLAISQLQNTTSKEFGLRIQIEDKQAFKSELEEIIKLRRELGLPLTSPLPKDEAEAKRTIENLKSAVKNLEDFKKLGEFTKDLDPLATFKNFNANNLIEQTKKFNELQTELAQKSDGVKQATEEEAIAKQLLTDKYIGLAEEQKKSLLLKAREIDQADAARKADEDRRKDLARDFRSAERVLRSKELEVQNAINAGVITEAQGRTAVLAIQRESAQQQIAILQNQAALEADPEKIAQFREQIEALKGLGAELTPLQGFFKGFRSEAETLAESFERIGKSFKDSVLGVVDSGIDKLTQKLGFFKSLVGDILKSLTRVLLGGLLQPRGGVAAAGGGGIGGILGSILGGGSGGGLGGFATGGFAGGGGAASILGGGSSGGGGGILGTLINAVGGGGISAPRSLSLGGLPIAGSIPFPTSAIPGAPGGGVGGGLSSLFGGLGGGLSGLFKGIGFGQKAGSGGALAGALPLLGLSLGSSLGTDRLTSILGGAAGGLLGIGLSAAPSIFAAGGIAASGGALSGLGFLGTLFSNPFTAIAAGLALPAIFLLGRARQRKRDEKTSGDALQDAVDQIKDIRKQVESNELTLNVSDARKLFDSQILQPFIAQISQLKSKSVRESRLKNQTVDLRNLFEKEVIPAVQAQKAKQGINDKLIPEFAFGGIVPGRPTPGIDSVLARLSPGEMVLTTNHQAMLQSIAGRNVFQAIGVPNSGEAVGDGSTAFASGGFVGAASRQVTTPTINMTVQLVVSGDEAVEILNAAASTDSGQQILVNARKSAQRNRLTR